MASFFGHTAAALAAARLTPLQSKPLRFWLLLCLCSILPDFDVIAFFLGIPYSSQWGHRGFTHSFVFAFVIAIVVATLAFRAAKFLSKEWLVLVSSFFLLTSSHSVLDALTNGGLGVAFFWPFDLSRYFFPYRPIEVSPIGVSLFLSQRGLEVIQSEIVFILAPCLLLVAVHYFLCKRKSR